MQAEDAEDAAERREGDEREQRHPAGRSFHQALHRANISHDCGGDWIDDYGWDRLPDALIAAGWTAPAPLEPVVGDSWTERPDRATGDVLMRWHNELVDHPDARERVMADIAHILGQAQAGDAQ